MEAFATFDDKINKNLSTKLTFTYNNEKVSAEYYGLQSTILPGSTPATATATNGQATGTLQGYSSVNPAQSFATDYSLSGNFKIFGLEQKFVIGANYLYYILDGGSSINWASQHVPDVFAYNPSLYENLKYEYGTFANSSYLPNLNRQGQYGVYANTKLEPFKNLHIYLGARLSGYRDKENGVQFGTPFVTPALKDASHSTLDMAGGYDFFRNFTLYASHESIYQPQVMTRYTVGGSIPPPVTGVNDEAGLKWQSASKLFNASIAAYHILKNNFETEGPDLSTDVPIFENVKSAGFDAEAAGQILPNWQVTGSFTNNTSKTVTSYQDTPLASFVPKDKLKLFTTYRPKGGGILGHMILGGGVNWQSDAFTTGYNPCVFNPSTFTFTCPPPYHITAKGFATVSLIAGYRINSHLELSLEAKNIANVKAYNPLQYSSTGNYNYYTEPLSVIASLRTKW